MKEFHDAVVDLQTEIDEFEQHETEYKSDRTELANELQAAAETVKRVQSFEGDDEVPLDRAEALFDAVEQAAAEADPAPTGRKHATIGLTCRLSSSLSSRNGIARRSLPANWPIRIPTRSRQRSIMQSPKVNDSLKLRTTEKSGWKLRATFVSDSGWMA